MMIDGERCFKTGLFMVLQRGEYNKAIEKAANPRA
jgi:hypothetical protein